MRNESVVRKTSVRDVVKIDEDLCNGCGQCVPACAEGAIQIVDGKARLIGDNLCDGLGACLGDCPEGAISIEQREAVAYDEKAVALHLQGQGEEIVPEEKSSQRPHHRHDGEQMPCGCPGARVIQFSPEDHSEAGHDRGEQPASQPSELRQWPIQLHLVPPTAPYFKGADVLLAADCAPFAIGDFHRKHLKGKALAIACPKLDQGQQIYLEKLTAMIDHGGINTLTVMVMEVPCCEGLVSLARQAAAAASRNVPVKRIEVGLRGDVLREWWL